MPSPRPSVPKALKESLVKEAGGKCANPGCSNYRTHLHHINEWAIYETHDGEAMIAVCPSCHDAIHQGPLEVSDQTIKGWKAIQRPFGPNRDHVYVEPGGDPAGRSRRN